MAIRDWNAVVVGSPKTDIGMVVGVCYCFKSYFVNDYVNVNN